MFRFSKHLKVQCSNNFDTWVSTRMLKNPWNRMTQTLFITLYLGHFHKQFKIMRVLSSVSPNSVLKCDPKGAQSTTEKIRTLFYDRQQASKQGVLVWWESFDSSPALRSKDAARDGHNVRRHDSSTDLNQSMDRKIVHSVSLPNPFPLKQKKNTFLPCKGKEWQVRNGKGRWTAFCSKTAAE